MHGWNGWMGRERRTEVSDELMMVGDDGWVDRWITVSWIAAATTMAGGWWLVGYVYQIQVESKSKLNAEFVDGVYGEVQNTSKHSAVFCTWTNLNGLQNAM